ncbi:class I SAM-dependent methyltransferase [bacterium]|nr:class I SAM-dependent methyltransferase [bacterium]
MCQAPVEDSRVLGVRLNRSQGRLPQQQRGVAVTVCQCRSCGLIFADPLPKPLSLQDHYNLNPEQYWPAEYFAPDPHYFCAQIQRLRSIMPQGLTGRALDIGAGVGKGMVALEQAGFDVWGIEPGSQFHQMATRRMGIDPARLQLTSIEEAVFPENHFDFITFGAVLEHLPRPAAALGKAAGWLKAGGIIHLEVPSSNWLVARIVNGYYRLLGTRWVTHLSPMHPPFHLYEFSPLSFEKAAGRLGLTVLEVDRQVCEVFHLPRFLHRLLRRCMAATNTGMQLTVWLARPG